MIPTYAEYGNILVPSTSLAKERGSGNYNPPPRYIQSTNRGNAWENAYPIYINKQNEHRPTSNHIFAEPIETKELGLAHFNTPSDLGDTLRRRIYTVGSTGLDPDTIENSWDRAEFEGAPDQYVALALKELHMTPTPFITHFFGSKNFNYIQNRIISEVKKIRNVTIEPQSVKTLMNIMVSKFIYAMSGWLPQMSNINYPHNRGETPCDLKNRIARLNQDVISTAVKQVLSGIDMNRKYIQDISSMPLPLTHPVYTSMKGGRVLSENIGFNSGHEQTLAANSYNQRFNIL
jgi:hypothetical protein